MGYRHYLYAVPKKQVAEIQECKTNEDWIDFAKRHDLQFMPTKIFSLLKKQRKYIEIMRINSATFSMKQRRLKYD